MSYVDAHLHLADPGYAGKIEAIIEDAARSNVTLLLSNGVDYDSSVQTISVAKQHKGTVFTAVGVHPWTVVNKPELNLDKFERLLNENRDHVKAIGEIGLDGKYPQDQEKRSRQRQTFQFFLRIAEERRLPVVVHSRLAVDEVLNELARFDLPRVLLHWYDGPVENLESIKDRRYLISIGPSLLYSKRIVEIARKADLSMILSETDGPVTYRGPFEGKMTQPSLVIEVIRKLAEIKSEKVETIRDLVWNNFQKLI